MFLPIVLFLHFLSSVSLQLTRPIVSLFASSEGASILFIGFIVSLFAILPIFFAIRIGGLLDKLGSKKMIIFGGFIMLTSYVFPFFFPNIYTLVLSQLLIGVGHLSVNLSLQKTIGNLKGNREKLIGWFALFGALGEFLGPMIGGFSYQYFNFRTTYFIASALITLFLIIIIFFTKSIWRISKPQIQTNNNIKSSFKLLKKENLLKVMLIGGTVLYSKDLIIAYFPLYGESIGMSSGTIGIILSTMAAMGILVRILQSTLINYIGRAKVLLYSLILSGTGIILIPFNTSTFIILLLIGVIGFGLGIGQPISLIYTLDLSPTNRHGEVLGIRITFNRGLQFLGPLIFGGVGGVIGLSPVFIASGGFLLFISYFGRLKK